MEDHSGLSLRKECAWLRAKNYSGVQRLAIHIIRDSLENVYERNEYYRDSFLFLVDSDGELSFWLSAFPEGLRDLVVRNIYKKLDEIPGLGMV